MKQIIPDAGLQQHIAVPAYKRDSRRILCMRPCAHCGAEFPVAKKFPDARFCSRKCGLNGTRDPEHNARISRASAKKRGDMQRGRGAGKSYPKLGGRHAHRAVAEKALGRQLLPGEVVHHVNENKLDYSESNIAALASQAEHARLHFRGTKQSQEHVRKRVASRKRTMAARKGGA